MDASVNELPSVAMRFAKGAGVSTLGRLAGRGFGYVVQIILARLLLPEAFGIFAIGWTLLRLLSVTTPLGLENGVIRFGSRYWKKDLQRFRGVFLISLIGAVVSGLFFGAILYLTSSWWANIVFRKPALDEVLKGFAFAFPLAAVLRVMVSASSISQKMLCGSIAEDVFQPVFQLVLFLILWRWTPGIRAALLATILSFLGSLLLSWRCAHRLIPEAIYAATPSFADFGQLLRFSLTTVVAITFGVLNTWGDRLIVGYFQPERDVGIYQSISLIAMFLVILLSGFKLIFAPMVAQYYQAGQDSQLAELVKVVTKWTLYLSFPVVLIVVTIPREILRLVYGEQYAAGALPLQILMLAQLLYMAFGVIDQLLVMTGHHKNWLQISAAAFFLSLLLDIWLVPIFGLSGAAAVSAISSLITLLLGVYGVRQLFRVWPYDIRHLKPLLAAIPAGVVLGLVSHLPFSDLFRFLVVSLVCFFIYYGTVLILGLDREDRDLLNAFVAKANQAFRRFIRSGNF